MEALPKIAVRPAVREGLASLLRAASALAAAKPTSAERQAIAVVLEVLWPSSAPSPPASPRPAPTTPQIKCGRCHQLGHNARNNACPQRRERRTKPAASPAAKAEPAEPPGAPAPDQGDELDDDPDLQDEPRALERGDRKWTDAPRASSIPCDKPLNRKDMRLHLKLLPWFGQRPRTRGECAATPRPCPFVTCRYHLYLDVEPESGSIKLNFPHLDVMEMGESCALDVADRSAVADQGHAEKTAGLGLEDLGRLVNVSLMGASELVDKAVAEVREKIEARGS